MKINFFNKTNYDIKIFKTKIKEILKKRLENNMSIIFVEDKEIHEMNYKYRGKNYITDVLSFPSEEEDYLGDIFISIDQASRQAKEINNTLLQEICFLSVHGYLHLIGYDHQNPEEEKEMILKQKEILKDYFEV